MNENLLKLFENAKTILITVAKNAKLDGVAAALALSVAATAQGKNTYVCTAAQLEEVQKLVGGDKITNALNLGGNTLKVTFPYRDGAIDKVTYNITDDTFNLLIEPQAGTDPLESKNVHYSYVGGAVDLIITIDAPTLDALDSIYLDNPDVFVQEKIVNIDRRFDNKNYGAENIVEKQASSTSELVLRLLQGLRWNINPDIATNLYAGLAAATNNFTSFSTNAQSFEAASVLLKSGARKLPMNPQPPMRPPGFGQFNQGRPNPFAPNAMGQMMDDPFGLPQAAPQQYGGGYPPIPQAPFNPPSTPMQQAPSMPQQFQQQPQQQQSRPVMPQQSQGQHQEHRAPHQHSFNQRPQQQHRHHQSQPSPQVQQASSPIQQRPAEQPITQQQPQQQAPQQNQSPQPQENKQQSGQTPQDWLKPKIFKSTTLN